MSSRRADRRCAPRGRAPFLLLAGLALAAAVPAQGVDDPVVSYQLEDYGTFAHYYYNAANNLLGDATFKVSVFQPQVPVANGAWIAVSWNSGFRSSVANPREVVNLYRDFFLRGYTIVAIETGSRATVQPDDAGETPKPGWTMQEIMEQTHHAIRFVKSKASYFNVNADLVGITGASSGGATALNVHTIGGYGDPASPNWVAGVDDAYTSTTLACVAFVAAGSVSDFRGAGDNSYWWMNSHFFFHPDLSGLSDPNNPGFNYPAPPAPPAACLQAQLFVNNMGDKVDGSFPQRNFVAGPPPVLLPWNTTGYTYPALCSATFEAQFAAGSALENLDSSDGPILMYNAVDDPFVTYYASNRFYTKALAEGVDIQYYAYPGLGHTWRDLDGDARATLLAFFDRCLLGIIDTDADGIPDATETGVTDANDADSDGDGQWDGAEGVAGTAATDSSSTLRITSVAQAYVSGQWQLVVTFPAVSGKSYVLQTTTKLDGKDTNNDATYGRTCEDCPQALWTTVMSGGSPIAPSITSGVGTFVAPLAAPPTFPYAFDFPVEYFRVAVEVSGAVRSVASAPVGRYTGIIARDDTSGNSILNLVGTPLHAGDRFQGEVTTVTADTMTFQVNVPLSITCLSGGNPASDWIAIVIDDGARHVSAWNPEDRGAEGRWWRVLCVNGGTVQIDRDGRGDLDAPPIWNTSSPYDLLPVGSHVAIRRLSTAEDLFGPDGGAFSPFVQYDRIRRYVPANNLTTGLVADYQYRTTSGSVLTGPHWRRLSDNAEFHANEITFEPDEAIGILARMASGGADSSYTMVGFVPMADTVAYVDGTPIVTPTGTLSHLANTKAWTFPAPAPLFTQYGAHTNLVESGFARNLTTLTQSDFIRYMPPWDVSVNGSPFPFTGDNASPEMTGWEDSARGIVKYWELPYPQSWMLIDQTQLPDAFAGVFSMLPGRGYYMRTSTSVHGGVFEWRQRKPYRRPL